MFDLFKLLKKKTCNDTLLLYYTFLQMPISSNGHKLTVFGSDKLEDQ